VPQPSLCGPLKESNLHDQRRPDPLHILHVLGRHPLPQRGGLGSGSSGNGQSSVCNSLRAAASSRRVWGMKPALTLPAKRSRLPA
jgi:hypothetical protein